MICKCPQCRKAFNYQQTGNWKPFCSERCKFIDLGDWLTEKNRIKLADQFDSEFNSNETKH